MSDPRELKRRYRETVAYRWKLQRELTAMLDATPPIARSKLALQHKLIEEAIAAVTRAEEALGAAWEG